MVKQARSKDDFGVDPWDLMGDPGSYGLGDPGADPWWTGDDGSPSTYWGGEPAAPGDDGSPSTAGWPGGDAGGGLPSWLSQIVRMLGGGSGGSGGGSGLGSLLPLLGIGGGIAGGLTANNATRDATDAMLRANQEATDLIRGRMEGASAPFKPYMDAGTGALGRIQSMPLSSLAAGFKPLGSGRGMTIGQLARGR